MEANHNNAYPAFFGFGTITLLLFVVNYKFMVETKGRTTRQIAQLFAKEEWSTPIHFKMTLFCIINILWAMLLQILCCQRHLSNLSKSKTLPNKKHIRIESTSSPKWWFFAFQPTTMDTLSPTFPPSLRKPFKQYCSYFSGIRNHSSKTFHLGYPYRHNASRSYDRGRHISFHNEILLQKVLKYQHADTLSSLST